MHCLLTHAIQSALYGRLFVCDVDFVVVVVFVTSFVIANFIDD